MTVTTTHLTRAAGVAAAVAGATFVAVQINHPAMEVASVSSTEWVVRNTAKVVMAGLILAGTTGMYLRQVKRMGVLGLVGYLLFSAGLLLILAVALVAGYVLPAIADTSPGFVSDVLVTAEGGKAAGDIGLMSTVFRLEGVGYLLGGLVFGIALFRAHVLARWACALLAVGTAATAALSVLPASFDRPMAVPTGIALVGLGVSLWRSERSPAPGSVSAVSPTPVQQPAVR